MEQVAVFQPVLLCCVADEIQRFMEEVKSLEYQDKPPYDKLRSILQAGLKAVQAKDDGKLEFTPANGAVPPPAKATKRKKAAAEAEQSDTDGSPTKKKKTVTKKKDVNGVKKSPKKTQRPRKALSTAKQSEPKSRLVEMGTQTSPGLALNSRGRTKKST
ncbi:serine/threonine-protein kinase VRK1-like isoform X2 [Larimichthys crocea]|uniref:serine/threonine-protein kinase VRK1-like isoform X2 n=1 Tax=Larimichthys crocea TaxID=215358 RepID=UPI000F5D8A2F|nr:serine/threonine-protein kinase VRK1-like isoform X2 [Larimichthys crocea]